ncbi:MAG: Dabb family protein [Verrucomicrobia bacterium]|nr:Dabb family protein [Verrucomicrobiota bacterium]
MIYHIVLFKLNPEVTPEKLETMMRQTRTQLLKIGEVLSLKCGKNIDPKSNWNFFLAVEFESTEKLALYRDSALHLKYVEEVIKPNTCERLAVDYEMEPGKDIRYS